MAIKCIWCKDTGKYYPLQGPAEPCRECAAFAMPAVMLPAPSNTLLVTHLTHEQSEIIRHNVHYSAAGYGYIATWKEHVPAILESLGWNALDTALTIDGDHWILQHLNAVRRP